MRRSKMTDDLVERACSLREEGWSAPRIARLFATEGYSVSTGAIYWHCLVNGADLPAESRRPSHVRPGAVERRGDHLVRRFTAEEDTRLLELEAQGLGYSAIGRQLDRKPNSIRGRLATLARREERADAR